MAQRQHRGPSGHGRRAGPMVVEPDRMHELVRQAVAELRSLTSIRRVAQPSAIAPGPGETDRPADAVAPLHVGVAQDVDADDAVARLRGRRHVEADARPGGKLLPRSSRHRRETAQRRLSPVSFMATGRVNLRTCPGRSDPRGRLPRSRASLSKKRTASAPTGCGGGRMAVNGAWDIAKAAIVTADGQQNGEAPSPWPLSVRVTQTTHAWRRSLTDLVGLATDAWSSRFIRCRMAACDHLTCDN